MSKTSKHLFILLSGFLCVWCVTVLAEGIDPTPGLPKSGEVLPFFPKGPMTPEFLPLKKSWAL